MYMYIYKEKTVTKTVEHNAHSESRRAVRADCKKLRYPSLLSRRFDRERGFHASRVKGKDRDSPKWRFAQFEWFRG